MPSITFTFDGLDELQAKLRTLDVELPAAVASSAREWCGDVMEASQQIVPERSGDLADSAYVNPPDVTAISVEVEMGYSSPYAVFVHEALDGEQPPSPQWSWTKHVERGGDIRWTKPGSGPKFLERPAAEMEHEIPERMAAAVLEVMEG